MSRIPFNLSTHDSFETTIDDPEWPCVKPVTVDFAYTAEEIKELNVFDNNGEQVSVTPEQERELIEEIWEYVSQNEVYV